MGLSRLLRNHFVLLLMGVLGGWTGALVQAQSEGELLEAEALARGPIHEAFAEPVVFDPQPGQVVAKAPPPLVEELPPEERPSGDTVEWIPGYWGWDDERNDFIWITGFWRVVPPGRKWVPGYWTETTGGFQWVSGFWSSASATTVEYLPAPPPSLEVGPSTYPPTAESVWSPGCWNWGTTHYVWRAGTWLSPPANRIWIPSYYVWSPRGFIYVDGYWDYSLAERGLLYAPVYLPPRVATTVAYRYQPRFVIDISILTSHFFVRPQTCHYYYGDYYSPNYLRSGVYPWFAFHTGRHGYDPIYTHYRHTHSRDWDDQIRADYLHRREHETARPPRTFASSPSIRPDGGSRDRDFRGGDSRDGRDGPSRDSRDDRSLVKPRAEMVFDKPGGPKLESLGGDRRSEVAKRIEDLRRESTDRSSRERTTGAEFPRTAEGRGSETGRDFRRPSPSLTAPQLNPPGKVAGDPSTRPSRRAVEESSKSAPSHTAAPGHTAADRVERGRGARPELPNVGGQERFPSLERVSPRSRPTPSFANERPAPTDRVVPDRILPGSSSSPSSPLPSVSANPSPDRGRPDFGRTELGRTDLGRPDRERVERPTPPLSSRLGNRFSERSSPRPDTPTSPRSPSSTSSPPNVNSPARSTPSSPPPRFEPRVTHSRPAGAPSGRNAHGESSRPSHSSRKPRD